MQTSEILDRFEQTIQASRALNWMLFCTHLQGDSLNKERDGIHTLFERQSDQLEEIVQLLSAETKGQLAAHSPAKVDAGHDPQMSPAELRERFIADHVRRGVSVPEIAEALNMKQAAVTKLVGELLGETNRPDNPLTGRRAVNE